MSGTKVIRGWWFSHLTIPYWVRRDRVRERFYRWLAWKLPRELVYWCAIRLIAHGTQGRWSSQVVPDLTAMDALLRWEFPDGKTRVTR